MNKKQKILIIEDVELNRAILREGFCSEFEILEAADGWEGLTILENESENLCAVFLDIIMPELDGFGVLQELQNRDLLREVPVFLITTEAYDYIIDRAYSYGVVDIIPKPINIQIIKRRVMNIIELYNNRNQLEILFNQSQGMISNQGAAIEHTNSKVIELLGNAVECRSAETGSHVRRIKHIAEIIAKDMSINFPEYGITEQKIKQIATASLLHDIGKISIPDCILNKPSSLGRLTKEEFEVMKTHTTAGCKMLEPLKEDPIYQFYYDISRYHHERWDGKGYPDGLKGNEIPTSSQIVSIADVYDALICKRVYKPAFTHEVAVKMINDGDCGCFNPDLLESFNRNANKIYIEIYKNDFDDASFSI